MPYIKKAIPNGFKISFQTFITNMPKFYLICFLFLFHASGIHSEIELSKMYSQFLIKWKITEDSWFESFIHESKEYECLRKTFVKISGINNLEFYLCLYKETFSSSIFPMVNLLPENLHVKLNYAYIYTPARIYKLNEPSVELPMPSGKLDMYWMSQDRNFRNEVFPNGTATIYCLITVKSQMETKIISNDHTEFKNFIHALNFTSDVQPTRRQTHKSHKEDFIENYIYSGQIPSFDISRAMDIIKLYSIHLQQLNAEELVGLSVEYLMENMTCESVVSILNLALENNIDRLRKKCLYYLKNTCYVTEKMSS